MTPGLLRVCPSCAEPGIREHSVLVAIEALATHDAASGESVQTYSRCSRCGALFHRPHLDALAAVSATALDERTVWIVPPWKGRPDAAPFEASWDVVEAFFEDQAVETDRVRPLYRLIAELRAAGLDSRLRAGQSSSSLGLSRSREDGLRAGQSHLFLDPQPDGSLAVRGLIGGEPLALEPAHANLVGPLRDAIDALAACEID